MIQWFKSLFAKKEKEKETEKDTYFFINLLTDSNGTILKIDIPESTDKNTFDNFLFLVMSLKNGDIYNDVMKYLSIENQKLHQALLKFEKQFEEKHEDIVDGPIVKPSQVLNHD